MSGDGTARWDEGDAETRGRTLGEVIGCSCGKHQTRCAAHHQMKRGRLDVLDEVINCKVIHYKEWGLIGMGLTRLE